MERYDLFVKRGETFSKTLLFKNPDGSVIDLTGCLGFCQVRPEPGSPELTCNVTVSIDGPAGEVRLSIDEDATADLEPGNYAYDFALQDGDGNVRYYLGGAFSVFPSVTVLD